jgi:WD40 repeat protein
MGTPSSENFGKLAHYPRGAGFFVLLRWHFRWGTRPDLDPDKVGTPWTADSFSAASYELGNVVEAVEPKTVDGWLNNETRPYPTTLRTIVAVLFRDSLAYEAWRAELQRAHSDIPARGRVRQDSRTTDAEETQRPLVGGKRPQTDQASIAATAEQDTVVIIDKLAQHFVGRSSDIEAIDSFAIARMDGDSRGLMVITAPPGIGKSALAAYWCKHAGKAANRQIVRHFCSMSNGSEQTKPEVIYEHLHKQIADFYGQPIGAARHMDALTHLLCKSPPDGQELVVWLDGIDEANGTVDCFVPYASGLEEKLGERVCIIISARAEPKITPAYLAPWLVGERAKTHNPEPYELGKLLPADIEALIKSLFAASDLAAPDGLAERIFKASDQGWPLFVRNMIDSAIVAIREGSDIDLGESPESLLGYAKAEIERLATLTDWRDLHPIFIFLTIAKQAVSRKDLEIILGKKIFPNTFPSQLRRWLNVIEDRSGQNNHMLSFAHPLLAKVFGQQLGDRKGDAEKEFVKAIAPLSYGDWPQYASKHLPGHLLEMRRMYDAVRYLTDIEFIKARFDALSTDACLTSMKADWMAWYGIEQRAKQETTDSIHDPMRHLRFWNNHDARLRSLAEQGHSNVWCQLMHDIGLVKAQPNAMLVSPNLQTLPDSLATLRGHKAKVTDVLLLPDDAGFLSWGWDHTLRLWSAAGEERAVLRGHDDFIYGALLLPNGAGFLSWSRDRTLRLWGAAGEEHAVLRGHESMVLGALLLPDGAGFLSWGDDRTLRLWGAAGEGRAVLRGHEDEVNGALPLPDGAGFLSWSKDNTLRLWSASGEAGPVLRGHENWVNGALLFADGAGILSWSDDCTFRLWSLAGEERRVLLGHERGKGIRGALLLPDGDCFLSWSFDETLRLWDAAGEERAELRGHKGWVNGALRLRGDTGFLSWDFDGKLRLWSLAGEERKVLRGHKRAVIGVLELPNRAGFLSWDFDAKIRLWSTAFEERAIIYGEVGLMGPQLLADGSGFLSWSWDHGYIIQLWSITGEERAVLRGHKRDVIGALVLPDGAGFLSWSYDGTLRLWSVAGEERAVLRGHLWPVEGALVLPDGAGFLSWSLGTLRLWSASGEERAVLHGHEGTVNGALLLPDGAGFLSWSADKTLRLWSASGEAGPVLRGHEEWINGALLLPDGRGFLSWGDDHMFFLWDWCGEIRNLWLSPGGCITIVLPCDKPDHYFVVFGENVGIVHLPFFP